MIEVPHPARRLIRHLINRVEQLLRQPVVANGSIEALGVNILMWLTWMNVFNPDSVFTGPYLNSAIDVFRAVIAPNYPRFATPADDLLQRPYQSLS